MVWTHRTYGDPPDPKYPWGATFYGDKGTLKASVMSYDFVPFGKDAGAPVHEDVVYELEQFPEDKTEKDLERHVAPAIRGHMKNLLECIASRGKPVADIEQGYSRRRRASWRTCRCSSAGRSRGITPRATVVGDAEANKLLRRPYRAPWAHPDAARV